MADEKDLAPQDEQQNTQSQSVQTNEQQEEDLFDYVPKVFAEKLTQDHFDAHPELAQQGINVGDIKVLREVSADDVKAYEALTDDKIGNWVLNGRFQTVSDDLDPMVQFKIELDVPKPSSGSQLDLRITARNEDIISIKEIVGALEIAKQSAINQAIGMGNQQQQGPGPMDMVDYQITQEDLDVMGDNNPGHRLGDIIKLPRMQAEMLLQSRAAHASQKGQVVGQDDQGKVIQMNKPKTDA